MSRSRLLLLPVAVWLFACSSDTITSITLTTDATPAPVTVSANGITMPVGLAIHVHVAAKDSKGDYGGDIALSAYGSVASMLVEPEGGSDYILFGVTPGTGTVVIGPATQGDNGTFSVPVTVTP